VGNPLHTVSQSLPNHWLLSGDGERLMRYGLTVCEVEVESGLA
jgi:hypothetical protein